MTESEARALRERVSKGMLQMAKTKPKPKPPVKTGKGKKGC